MEEGLFKKILRSYESPWEFEISGSFRSSIYGGKMYCLKKNIKPIFDYDYGFLIIKGKQNEELVNYFNDVENLNLNFKFDKVKDGNVIIKKDYNHYFRLVKYFFKAIVSLIKKG